jgi:hypothetical protein
MEGARRLITEPITIINCPSRRQPVPFPNAWPTSAINAAAYTVCGRTDYAINAGHQSAVEYNGGPGSIQAAATFSWVPQDQMTGVSYQRSEVSIGQIADGTSNTILIAEKYLMPDHYDTGTSPSDNETWCTGHNNDMYRTTFAEPFQDRVGFNNNVSFGSAHGAGFHISRCDGSVDVLEYGVDPTVFLWMGHRSDGTAIR